MGANSFEMLPPALNNAMSIPAKESLVNSLIAMSSPRNFKVFPTERAEASNVNLPTGKLRFSSVLIISTPTRAGGADDCNMRSFIHTKDDQHNNRASRMSTCGRGLSAPSKCATCRRAMKIKRRQFLAQTTLGLGATLVGAPLFSRAEDAKPKFFDPFEPVPLGKTKLKFSRVVLGTGMKGWSRQSNQARLGKEKLEALIRDSF